MRNLLKSVVACTVVVVAVTAPAAAEKYKGEAPRLEQDPTRIGLGTPTEARSSLPLWSIQPKRATEPMEPQEINPPKGIPTASTQAATTTLKMDPLAERSLIPTGTTPGPLFTFDGLGTDGFTPPDTVGEVGPNHYIQMVNVSFQVFDKTGTPVSGDLALTDLFTGSGLTACENENDGDPIALYDRQADRWLLSQFAVSSGLRMCVAISQTGNPMGSWWLYQFTMPDFPDYFKFGVWGDAYYMSTNTGFPNAYYAYAFDRAAMLTGAPATFQFSNGHPNFMMPADLDGPDLHPAGEPGIFYTFLSDGYPNHPPGVDRLAVYEFDVDWANPGNTTFTLVQEIPIAAFNYTVCGFFVGNCIPQPGTTQRIDSLSYWPMWRFAYRNLGDREALVGNFTVDVDGSDRAAIRWFELSRTAPANPWSLAQEGTHAPDTDHRFMGSIAMDRYGNIALGYTVSSATQINNIRYAIHEAGDPAGTMQAEATMYVSSGVHTGIHRWGDYSSLNVDPADDCTFWYTNQYDTANNSGFTWVTRVGVFRAPGCGSLFVDGFESGDTSGWDSTSP